jgi:hypothetical protein
MHADPILALFSFFSGGDGQSNKKDMPGTCLKIAALFHKTALPGNHTRPINKSCLVHCARLVPIVADRFSARATEFFLNSWRLLGREKGACDKLRRHPLIDSIFGPHPWPLSCRRGEVFSIPFAREDLHLVIPSPTGLSRYISTIQFSITQNGRDGNRRLLDSSSPRR